MAIQKDLLKSIISTELIDNDTFRDKYELSQLETDKIDEGDLDKLWSANLEIYNILIKCEDLEDVRENLFDYLNEREKRISDIENKKEKHILELINSRECVRTFKNMIIKLSEKRAGFSALECLWKLANDRRDELKYTLHKGFILEFIHLFKGVLGLSNLYSDENRNGEVPRFFKETGREAALIRSDTLDSISDYADKYINRYVCGLREDIIEKRKENKKRILKYFNATEDDWQNYKWHLRNIIRDYQTLSSLIDLSKDESEAVKKAVKNKLYFGITPYYVSLMDKEPSRKYDNAVRAQVIPTSEYVDNLVSHNIFTSIKIDYHGETDTSPIDLITRRYPKIVILKPVNTCAQICIYCQRNWEIQNLKTKGFLATREKVENAINWVKEHPAISEVLVTGGDPFIMNDERIDHLMGKLSKIDHIERIRIGTRIPVVLPQRINNSLLGILNKYHKPGQREVCVATHFEHPYEISPESRDAVIKIRKLGITMYNQTVYTLNNSRKFENAALRKWLKLIGIDPYYTFYPRSYEDKITYRVPIARLIQEMKEEARLFPGVVITEIPVQNHRLIMILPDGRRIYEFHPWEKNISKIPTYVFVDVSIHNYLNGLKNMGENIEDYKTIWYYY